MKEYTEMEIMHINRRYPYNEIFNPKDVQLLLEAEKYSKVKGAIISKGHFKHLEKELQFHKKGGSPNTWFYINYLEGHIWVFPVPDREVFCIWVWVEDQDPAEEPHPNNLLWKILSNPSVHPQFLSLADCLNKNVGGIWNRASKRVAQEIIWG